MAILTQQPKSTITEIWDQSLREYYLTLVESYADFACSANYDVRPYVNRDALYFDRLPHDVQKRTVRDLQHFISVCTDVICHDHKSLTDSQHFLWRMLQKSNLRPTSDLFSHIQKNDIIEIYSLEFIQIFRNMDFFRVCSYSLDDILCRQWWELFKRDDSITNHILQRAGSVFQGTHNGTITYHSGVHIIDEIASPRMYRGIAENKIFSPLFDEHGQIAAGVNIVRSLSFHEGGALLDPSFHIQPSPSLSPIQN